MTLSPTTTHLAGPREAPDKLVLIFVLCAAAALVEGIDIQSTGIVAPQYAAEFALSKQQVGAIFGLNNLGLFVGSIVAGLATDKLGRRWTAIVSMLFFGAFSIGCALAPSGSLFTVARVLLGVGIGGSLANIIALVSEAGPAQTRASRVTITTAVVAVGGAIPGAILAAWPHLNWRWIYHIGGWSPILVGLIMLLWLPESRPYLQAKSEEKGPKPSGALGAFTALFGSGRAPVTLLLWLATFGTFLAYYVINNWLPSLMAARSFSTRDASLAAMTFTGGGAVGSVLLGLLLARARRLAILASFIGCAVGLVGLALVETRMVLLAVIFGLGFFATTAKNMMYGFAPLYYPVVSRGLGVGAAVSLGRIGSIVGPAAAGLMLGAGKSAASVMFAILPVVGLSLVATLVLTASRSREVD